MNTSTIAIAIGAAITTGGIAYVVTSQPPIPVSEQVAAPDAKPAPARSISTPSAPGTKSSSPNIRGSKSSSPNTNGKSSTALNKPAGMSDELWKRAQERAERFSEWANRSRDSERSRRRLEGRVQRDSQAIAKRLGLPEESTAVIQKILTDRIEKSITRANSAIDAITSNEEAMAFLAATRELQTSDAGISAELLAKRNATKKELFGDFYKDGSPPESIDIGDLIRPDTPRSWYKDDDFLVSATTGIDSTEAGKLMDYAGKLDYLDRQDNAFNHINRLERSVDLSTRQSTALKNLYTNTPSPTPEQIAQVVGQSKATAIKQASEQNRRRR